MFFFDKRMVDFKNLFYLFLVNISITILLTLISFPSLEYVIRVFIINGLFTFSIGSFIYFFAFILQFSSDLKWYFVIIHYSVVFMLGGVFGTILGYFLSTMIYSDVNFHFQTLLYHNIVLAFFFGAVGSSIVTGKLKLKEIIRELSEKEINEEKLKVLKAKAELEALKAKINPHFLFNTLNSIASLIHLDSGKAEEMVILLSSMFQSILDYSSRSFISLEKEIQLAEMYLEIEKVRFGERLRYEIILPENIKNELIPSLIIQPLVENSIKHAISKELGTGKIIIECRGLKDEMIYISVRDTGSGGNQEILNSPKGFGIRSIKEKLELFYSGNYEMKVNINQGTEIFLSFPRYQGENFA